MCGKSHPVNKVGQNPGPSEITEHVITDLEDYRKPVQSTLLRSAPQNKLQHPELFNSSKKKCTTTKRLIIKYVQDFFS